MLLKELTTTNFPFVVSYGGVCYKHYAQKIGECKSLMNKGNVLRRLNKEKSEVKH